MTDANVMLGRRSDDDVEEGGVGGTTGLEFVFKLTL